MHFPSAQKVALRGRSCAHGSWDEELQSADLMSFTQAWLRPGIPSLHPYFNCSIDDLRSRSTIWIQCKTFGYSHGDYAVILGLASNQMGSTFDSLSISSEAALRRRQHVRSLFNLHLLSMHSRACLLIPARRCVLPSSSLLAPSCVRGCDSSAGHSIV